MSIRNTLDPRITRRHLLRSSGLGFGALALAGILQEELQSDGGTSTQGLSPRPGHFPGKARAVIQLFQNGGASQMDLFDPKPELTKRHGQPHPNGVEVFQPGNQNILLKSPFRFQHRGNCGMELSDVIPHLSSIADDLCMIRSMHTKDNNHPFAIDMMQSGSILPGRPAMGSWISYALGTENRNLPCYVVLRDPRGYNTSGKMVWSCGWLPAIYQGTEFSSSGNAVHHLTPSRKLPGWARRRNLKLLAALNEKHRRAHPRELELEARIENYELAARMQIAAADVSDIERESPETRTLYGLDNPTTAGYGRRVLMARRLIEAGVRFVQVFPPVKPNLQPWDNHSDVKGGLETICAATDQPSAALIQDLKQRGLLDDVIVLWTGEFGRLPTTQGKNGRDHNRNAFSLLVAGGGFKSGHVHGATDDFGYAAVDGRVSVHDLHATVLQQLGIDHRELTYMHDGRPQTLTDAEVTGAQVVEELLA